MRQCIADGTVREIEAGIPDIRYVDMKYDNFDVREVVIDGNNIGEFHVNIRCIPGDAAVNFLRSKIEGEIFLIDPENYLNLEFNIYVKVDPNSMSYMTISDTFTKIDEKITERK